VISQRAFSLLYLNPPYDWSIKDDDMAPGERYELAFLRDTFKYLIPFGVLIYLIPHHRLDKKIAQILAWHFSDVKVFRFPAEEYERFSQIVIFGVLKKQAEWNRELSLELQEMGKNPDIPFLNRTEASYAIPISPNVHRFVFRTRELNKDDLFKELTLSPLKEKIRKMVSPVYLSEKIKPIMPLRKGHLAQILACGLMNDVVFDRNGRNPLVIKGITQKSTETCVEYNDGTEKTIETDRIIISVTAISEYGEITDLS
jgi:hypothetical protein